MRIALKIVSDRGEFGHGIRVDVVVGISGGLEAIVGQLGAGTSAHAWTAVGDSAEEAELLAHAPSAASGTIRIAQ